MVDDGQDSLFDARGLQSNVYNTSGRAGGKEHLMRIAAASMVEYGRYVVAGLPVRVDNAGNRGKNFYVLTLPYGRSKKRRWVLAIQIVESETKFVFSHFSVGQYADAQKLYYNLVELMGHQTACRREYARSEDRCSECNRKLENPRSRHYALGSECITKRPDIVAAIDAELGYTWNEISIARGET